MPYPLRMPLRTIFYQSQCRLKNKKFLKDQPPMRLFEVFEVIGEMDVSDGELYVGKPVAGPQLRRQYILQRAGIAFNGFID